jgi:DNA-binding NarL/FixJ family response regulator
MKILLADDHRMLRDGLEAVLAREPDLAVVGTASDGREAVAQALALRPDVVVMDVSMPGLNGMEATRRIVHEHPGSKVIGLSMHADRSYVQAMFEAGACGYLLKNAASHELVRALRAVADGKTYVSPGIGEVVVAGFVRGQAPLAPSHLTAREREVVQLLAEGLTSKEVATRLVISVSTVETYRRQIMAKLDIHSVAELTKYAIRHGLASAD